jgi:hypothetical protein
MPSSRRAGPLQRAPRRVASARSSITIDPIPQLMTTAIVGHTFRFQASTSASQLSVTKSQLLNSVIVNTSSSTSNIALIKAMKINKICMYSGASAGGGNSANLVLEWISTAGPNVQINRVVTGMADVAVLESKSPSRSLASFWFDSGVNESDVMFYLTCPTGAFVDVHVTLALGNDTNARQPTTAASGTAGLCYYTFLDGPRSGAIFAPIGFQSLN